ncbi:MAG: hypothetical protein KIG52_08040, partial [Muribaculaceae bacterium]|nr:hypothetical protein [Muribaculaceae bacterium]
MTQTIAFAAIAVLAIATVIVSVYLAFTLRKCSSLSTLLSEAECDKETLNRNLMDVTSQLRSVHGINDELRKSNDKLNAHVNALQKQHVDDKAELSRLSEILRQAREDQEALANRQAELRRQSEETFRNIANDILRQNSTDFKQANETRLLEILKPVKDHFESINNSIRKYYEDGLKETASLKDKISELQE